MIHQLLKTQLRFCQVKREAAGVTHQRLEQTSGALFWHIVYMAVGFVLNLKKYRGSGKRGMVRDGKANPKMLAILLPGAPIFICAVHQIRAQVISGALVS